MSSVNADRSDEEHPLLPFAMIAFVWIVGLLVRAVAKRKGWT